MLENIHWLGHGSFRIEGPPIIYINPWRVTIGAFHADAILIGHEHYEHFSLADVNKLRGETTQVITNDTVAEQVENATVLRPWHSLTVDRASIKAVPAYSPNAPHHPQDSGGLGFVISINFYDIYYAGDTGITPELARIKPDIAILPIDGNGTLSIHEAAEIVDTMRPRWVIPTNWGTIAGGKTLNDAQDFKTLVGGRAEVIIPTKI